MKRQSVLNKRSFLFALGLALILLAASATWALAQSDGVIYACVVNDGTLRIVPDADQCKKNETLLSWNIMGPQGNPGLACWDLNGDGIQDANEDINQDGLWDAADCKGAQGDPGPAGAEGPQGAPGMQGEPGDAVKAAPPCFDNSGNRYVDCGNGTVTDIVTGLIWLKTANCFGTRDWAAANNAAAGLGNGACGLTDGSSPGDWRLPTKEEWKVTIAQAVALSCANPPLTDTAGTGCYSTGAQPFTDVPLVQYNWYWSSTSNTLPHRAWIVGFHFGTETNDLKTWNFFVWPVRGGQ